MVMTESADTNKIISVRTDTKQKQSLSCNLWVPMALSYNVILRKLKLSTNLCRTDCIIVYTV